LSIYRYAKHKKSSLTLSIKIVEKNRIIKDNLVEVLYNEYKLAKFCNHPFIVTKSIIK